MSIASRISNAMYLSISKLGLFRKLALLYGKDIAQSGKGSDRCLALGYLPVPVHFYSPLPDLEELKKRKVWAKKSSLPGINFNEKKQLALLKKLGRFGKECVWPTREEQEGAYYIDGNVFGYGCAASTYSMIRLFKPRRIIEIGSGFSSKVISQAVEKNASSGDKTRAEHIIIDPYPGEDIASRKVKYDRLIKEQVEVVDQKIFQALGNNDILFIDSSHSLKIGGDVYSLYLEILPKLNKGVIVHIHDINLPYEYPQHYALSESFRQFWTEQYMLQAFLSLNSHFEVMLGMKFIMKDHLAQFRQAFPFHKKINDRVLSGSFWIKRVS